MLTSETRTQKTLCFYNVTTKKGEKRGNTKWETSELRNTEIPEINVFDVVGVEKVYRSALVSLGYRGLFRNYISNFSGKIQTCDW